MNSNNFFKNTDRVLEFVLAIAGIFCLSQLLKSFKEKTSSIIPHWVNTPQLAAK